ncbi:MAG: DMT family transporter [Planctomycetota bacterium]
MTATGDSRRPTRALLIILAVTVLWGWTFVWMKQAITASSEVLGAQGMFIGIAVFLTVRFGLAALVMGAIPAVRRRVDANAWRGGWWIGLSLLSGFLLQMGGLIGTSPSVSAFLTSLYVLFTAIVIMIRDRRRPYPGLIVGGMLATFGAGFIDGPPQLSFGLAEWLSVACALCFAVHIVLTDIWTRRVEPLAVAGTSFVVVAVGSAAVLVVAMANSHTVTWSALGGLFAARGFVVPLMLSSLLATVLALSLMNMFQRELGPVRAAIVYALEPVWASIFACLVGLGQPTIWLAVGGGALLLGNILAEIIPARRGDKPT